MSSLFSLGQLISGQRRGVRARGNLGTDFAVSDRGHSGLPPEEISNKAGRRHVGPGRHRDRVRRLRPFQHTLWRSAAIRLALLNYYTLDRTRPQNSSSSRKLRELINRKDRLMG